jgi:hypothetical protein
MKINLSIWIVILAVLSLVMMGSCGILEKNFQEETITTDNKAEIIEKSETELTVEESRLLKQYLERSYPDLGENDLPLGRTLAEMINEEKTIQATSMAASSSDQTGPEQTEETVQDEPEAAPKSESRRESRPAPQASASPPPTAQPNSSAPPASSAQSRPSSQPDVPTTQVSDTAQQAAGVSTAPEQAASTLPQPIIVEVDKGADIMVRLVESLSTETAQSGDRFELELAEDLKVGEELIAPKGTRARGRVITSEPAGKVKGLATMSLTLTDLFIEGEQFPIKAETLTYQAEKTTGKDAAKVGVASGIGAVIGAIVGGGKGAAIGAGVGAGAGTGTVLATKGDELVFPVEQMFRFRLTEPFKVEIYED